MKFIVAIVGSRDINDQEFVNKVIEKSGFADKIKKVVSGGARGVDACAEVWADEHGIKKKILKAKWDTYGKEAGGIRNTRMVEYLSKRIERAKIIAIPGPKSVGTYDMIRKSKAAGIEVYEYKEKQKKTKSFSVDFSHSFDSQDFMKYVTNTMGRRIGGFIESVQGNKKTFIVDFRLGGGYFYGWTLWDMTGAGQEAVDSLKWILSKDFPDEVKKTIMKHLEERGLLGSESKHGRR